MYNILIFVFSFSVYTAFQWFDAHSTRLALSKLSLEMHEINPILVSLSKRIGVDLALTVMALAFATFVGLVDVLYSLNAFRFPIMCFLFGMFHILAAANNLQIYFEVETIGPENFDRNTRYLIQMLKQKSFVGKIGLLIKLNLFKVFLAIYGLVSLLFLFGLLGSLVISIEGSISSFLFYLPPIMILAFITFFPVNVFGIFLISLRRLKSRVSEVTNLSDPDVQYISLPVDVLEVAFNEAKATNAEYIQFSVSDRQKVQK